MGSDLMRARLADLGRRIEALAAQHGHDLGPVRRQVEREREDRWRREVDAAWRKLHGLPPTGFNDAYALWADSRAEAYEAAKRSYLALAQMPVVFDNCTFNYTTCPRCGSRVAYHVPSGPSYGYGYGAGQRLDEILFGMRLV
jgi:hypothetical protein